jgi:hypothetical protein
MLPTKLSREEKESVNRHLTLALGVFFFIGLIVAYLGVKNHFLSITISGALISFLTFGTYLGLTIMEHLKYLHNLRAPHLEQFNLHCNALLQAKDLVNSINEEFPNIKKKSEMRNRSGFLNFLSLERLIENLEIRLIMIEEHLFSKSETSVLHAIELMEAPLVFTSKLDEHVIDHEMPDMPSSTWLDSLNFLTSKVKEEKERFREESPMHSLKSS